MESTRTPLTSAAPEISVGQDFARQSTGTKTGKVVPDRRCPIHGHVDAPAVSKPSSQGPSSKLSLITSRILAASSN